VVEDGLENLFRRYGRSVLLRAGAILGDRDAAKDVMQEVFLQAIDYGSKFLEVESPIYWLHRVTTNLCLNRLRDGARRRRILSTSVPSNDTAPPSSAPIDTLLTVRALLRQVPDDLQEIAICYFVDQMSQDEIATMTGIPRRTVSYRLEQFRELAQTMLNQEVAS
jgi:RNA polymerase sigma-70 factor, ECF subfamily